MGWQRSARGEGRDKAQHHTRIAAPSPTCTVALGLLLNIRSCVSVVRTSVACAICATMGVKCRYRRA